MIHEIYFAESARHVWSANFCSTRKPPLVTSGQTSAGLSLPFGPLLWTIGGQTFCSSHILKAVFLTTREQLRCFRTRCENFQWHQGVFFLPNSNLCQIFWTLALMYINPLINALFQCSYDLGGRNPLHDRSSIILNKQTHLDKLLPKTLILFLME